LPHSETIRRENFNFFFFGYIYLSLYRLTACIIPISRRPNPVSNPFDFGDFKLIFLLSEKKTNKKTLITLHLLSLVNRKISCQKTLSLVRKKKTTLFMKEGWESMPKICPNNYKHLLLNKNKTLLLKRWKYNRYCYSLSEAFSVWVLWKGYIIVRIKIFNSVKFIILF
jgi:hypothetical protein